MFISPHLSSSEQWKQKQKIIIKLFSLAKASIFDDPKEKDKLKKDFLRFFYANYFDQSQGGYISQCDISERNGHSKSFFKPIIANIYLYEVLFACNPVLCDGEISYYQKLIFEYITDQIKIGNLRDSQRLPIEELSCFYSIDTVEALLSTKEKSLFYELTSSNDSNEKGVVFSYKKSLKVAASKIGMELKEAQIIEYSLKSKLQLNKNDNIQNLVVKEENTDQVIFEAIIALMSFFNSKNENRLILVVNQLYKMIDSHNKDKIDSIEYLINHTSALIYFLQVNFEQQILEIITRNINLLSELGIQDLNERESYRFELIRQFCIAIQRQEILSFPKLSLEKMVKLTDPTYELVFLEKNQPKNEHAIVKFQSEFNPYRLVFLR